MQGGPADLRTLKEAAYGTSEVPCHRDLIDNGVAGKPLGERDCATWGSPSCHMAFPGIKKEVQLLPDFVCPKTGQKEKLCSGSSLPTT